jgi:hypothetical protein
MAWVERRGGRYRVRERRGGRKATVHTFDDRADALGFVARSARLDLAVRRRSRPTPPPTLAGWIDAWLPAHTASPSTLAKYESLLRAHILPAFGRRHLDAITRNDVKTFARDLSARLSPASVRSVVTVLGLVLREAIDEHYLFFDPTARLRLRDGPAEPRPTADPVQVQTLADRMPDRARVPARHHRRLHRDAVRRTLGADPSPPPPGPGPHPRRGRCRRPPRGSWSPLGRAAEDPGCGARCWTSGVPGRRARPAAAQSPLRHSLLHQRRPVDVACVVHRTPLATSLRRQRQRG